MLTIEPMLAQSAPKPFQSADYLYEQKLDGVRCIAFLDDCTVLRSRTGQDITAKFPELHDLHRQAWRPMILDGEIMAKSFKGTQSRVQKGKPFEIRLASKSNPCLFYAFDLLSLNRQDTTGLTCAQRKFLLGNFDSSEAGLVLPWHDDGIALYNAVIQDDGEGIMAKLRSAQYSPGKRSPAWLKIKAFAEETFYIVGCTQGEGRRDGTFGALVLARKTRQGLEYAGNCGTGFTDADLQSLDALMHRKAVETPYFPKQQIGEEIRRWTEPIKCEIRHLRSGCEGEDKLRFPSFRGLRK